MGNKIAQPTTTMRNQPFSMLAAVVLPALLFLSSCTSSPSEPSSSSGGETTTISATIWKHVDDVVNDAPVYWAGENLVGITTYGSHDCYDEPTALTLVSPNEATVEWKLVPTGPCDSNIQGVSFEAKLPDGIDTTKPITVSGLNGSESSIELPVQQ